MPRVSYKKPPILPIFGRVINLTLFFAVAVFTAATWFSWGLTWLYDSGTNTWPIYECPSFIMNLAGVQLDQGPRCRLSLSANSTLTATLRESYPQLSSSHIPSDGSARPGECLVPLGGEEGVTCYSISSCDRSCRRVLYDGSDNVVVNEECPPPSSLASNDRSMCMVFMHTSPSDFVVLEQPCVFVSTGSFCDSDFRITPSNEFAIRGLLIGAMAIVVIWFLAEWVLFKVDCDLRRETAVGAALQAKTLPLKRQVLEELTTQRWVTERDAAQGGGVSGKGSGTPRSEAVFTREETRLSLPVREESALSKRSPGVGSSSVFGGTAASPSVYTAAAAGEVAVGSGPRAPLESRDPRRRFECAAWKRRVRQWQKLRADKKSTFTTRQFARSLMVNVMFMVVIVLTMYVVLLCSPSQMKSVRSDIVDIFVGNASVWVVQSWLDILIFVDIILDVGLFLLACAVVHWPKPPLFARHINTAADEAIRRIEQGEGSAAVNSHKKRSQTQAAEDDDLSLSGGASPFAVSEDNRTLSSRDEQESELSFVMQQSTTVDVCLMIACHESTINPEKSETFTNTLKSALMVFPPSHIFVCDNGNSAHPVDDTQMVAREVHPDINYLYIPEGNKTFAFYWCNRYWVPFLAKCGRVPDFKYAVIIDDDVPLPADLHIPHEHLRQNPDIKAVHFPITAASASGSPNLLVQCQDVEYKMAAVHKYFQSSVARSLSCHGAVALWHRGTMDSVFYDHDTVFHGEDLYMGLTLLRKRDDSRILSRPQSIVPTYAPDTWGMLFRQRVKSWELTSHKKTLTYLMEVFNPMSLCHCASWALKPYFLQELLTIILDWLRIFLLAGLLLRDWVGLVILIAVFECILYGQVLVFEFVYLRHRRDLRSSCVTVFLFPWYRLCNLVFRLCALCQNLLVYSKERKAVKIGFREDEIRDIPPTPPHPDVLWFSVWCDDRHKKELLNTPSTHPSDARSTPPA